MVEQQWNALINYTTNEVKTGQYTHTHTLTAEEFKHVGYNRYGSVLYVSNCSDVLKRSAIEVLDLKINSMYL